MTDDTKTTRKNRGGRPKSDNPRTTQIMVRLTPEEKDRIHERAGETGAAEYMRSLALGRVAKLNRQVPELNREAWIELSRLAGNLNQLAHRSNSGEHVQAELDEAIRDCRQLLDQVRTLLLTGSEDVD